MKSANYLIIALISTFSIRYWALTSANAVLFSSFAITVFEFKIDNIISIKPKKIKLIIK